MLARVDAPSPKDRFVTVFGRTPVLEALADGDLRVDKVVLADNARGAAAREILDAAAARSVRVERASAHRVKVLAGNGKQDQGVLADVVAPRMRRLSDALAAGSLSSVLVLDQHNRVQPHQIKIGLQDPTRVEVLAGLQAGDRVIVGNFGSYQAGQIVEPKLARLSNASEAGGDD